MALPPPMSKPTPELLPGIPRRALTPEQQLEALRRVQAQAEQRVQLGMQLYKAAEARVSEHRQALDEVRAESDRLREQITGDVTKTLQQYDQWIGKIDESFTHAIRDLAERMEKLETAVAGSEDRLEQMVGRTEALLDQARVLLNSAAPRGVAAPKPSRPAPVTPPPAARREPSPEPSPAPATTDAAPAPAPADGPIYSQLLKRLRGDTANDKAA